MEKKLLIEAIGLIAVVLSLIFLAIEVQQNSLLMRSQIRDSVTDKQIAFYSILGANPEVSEIMIRALTGEDLSNAESSQFLHWASASLRMWENEWFQYQNGLFAEEEFAPRMEVWRGMSRFPGFRDLWNAQRNSYSPNFRNQMNAILGD